MEPVGLEVPSGNIMQRLGSHQVVRGELVAMEKCTVEMEGQEVTAEAEVLAMEAMNITTGETRVAGMADAVEMAAMGVMAVMGAMEVNNLIRTFSIRITVMEAPEVTAALAA